MTKTSHARTRKISQLKPNPLNPRGMEKIDLMAERFRADKRFFAKIEDAMPPGTKVFCIPYTGFPESPPVYKMSNY